MQLYDETNNQWFSHRQTREYRLRKRKLRDAWLCGAPLLLVLPPPLTLVFGVAAVFMSLSFLDEGEYQSINAAAESSPLPHRSER